MGLSKGVINALVEKKIDSVIPKLNEAEMKLYDSVAASPKIKELVAQTIVAQDGMKAAIQEVEKWETKLENAAKGITTEFEKRGLRVRISGTTAYGGYDIRQKVEIERISLDAVKSDKSDKYGCAEFIRINPESNLGRAASEALKDASLKLRVALETNNRKEVLKMIEDFSNLKLI
jgi:hypothetical protein